MAKVFRRKDVVTMRLEDAEPSSVGLAWPREGQHPLVDEFIGIVRGRSAHSSRNPEVAATEAAQGKKAAKKGAQQQGTGGTAGKARNGSKKPGKPRGQVTRRARRGGA